MRRRSQAALADDPSASMVVDLHPTNMATNPCHGGNLDLFLKLPIEIIAMVAEHLSHDHLAALRATCMDLNLKTLNTFAKAHFVEPAFILPHREHMNQLLSLSEHPVFSKAIRKVSLHVGILRTVNVERRYSSPEVGTWQAQHQRKYRRVRDTQYRGIKHSMWRPVLIRSLINLCVGQRKIELEIFCPIHRWNFIERPASCGLRTLQNELHRDVCLGSAWFLQHTLDHLTYAGLLEILRAANLSLVTLGRSRSAVSFVVQSIDAPVVMAGGQFERLQSFGLYLGTSPLATFAEVRKLAQNMSLSPILESVTIYGTWHNPADQMPVVGQHPDDILTTLYVPKLRDIELRRCSISQDELVGFVRRHRKTLQSVLVEGVYGIPVAALKTLRTQVAEEVECDLPVVSIEHSDSQFH